MDWSGGSGIVRDDRGSLSVWEPSCVWSFVRWREVGIETIAGTKTGTCSVLTLREGRSQSKVYFRPEPTNATANTPGTNWNKARRRTSVAVASPVRRRSASLAFL
jgi:hypothetical protein